MKQPDSFTAYSNEFPQKECEIEMPQKEVPLIIGHVIARLQGI